MGSGRSELARILFGLDPFETGSIRINGRSPVGHNAARSIRSGMAFVTENRREEGLMMESAISDNIALVFRRLVCAARRFGSSIGPGWARRRPRGRRAEDQGGRHPPARPPRACPAETSRRS
jgi:ABC-type uncharacterized transport system ATPase component